MRTYLSIDLDFWRMKETPVFAYRALALPVPKCIVVTHHELLPHIKCVARRMKLERIVNLDAHSDLVGTDALSPNWSPECGNWVNYIGDCADTYIWSFPEGCYDHDTDTGIGLIVIGNDKKQSHPFKDHPRKLGWQRILARKEFFPRMRDIAAVGVALSPRHVTMCALGRFLLYIARHPELMHIAMKDVRRMAQNVVARRKARHPNRNLAAVPLPATAHPSPDTQPLQLHPAAATAECDTK